MFALDDNGTRKLLLNDYLGLPWIALDYLGLPWLTFDLPSTSSCEAVMYEAYYTSKEVCLCPKKTLRRLTTVSPALSLQCSSVKNSNNKLKQLKSGITLS